MRPEEVAEATRDLQDPASDAADQAERLTMIMEAEAALGGVAGNPVPAYPLDDLDGLLLDEDADDDASDDPMHHGGADHEGQEGLGHRRSTSAEEAAMHIVDGDGIDRSYLSEEGGAALTPEDATLLGIDPYEGDTTAG